MLKITKITFPGLFPGLELNVNSVAFTLFGHAFPWYALLITSGMVFCYFYCAAKGKKVGIKTEDTADYAIWLITMGVIGARLYYVFTSWDYYGKHPEEIIQVWNGGLGIYGGLIAGAIACIVVCKVKKISFFLFADIACPCILVAQAVGRWGNFFNAEAYGAETNIFCRMGINNTIFVHPTFFYESLWNIIGFALGHTLYKHKKYDGEVFAFVFAWYGFGRMFIELLRSDSLYISSYHAWFTKISVLVGFAFFVGCTTFLVYRRIKMAKGTTYSLTVPTTIEKETKNAKA